MRRSFAPIPPSASAYDHTKGLLSYLTSSRGSERLRGSLAVGARRRPKVAAESSSLQQPPDRQRLRLSVVSPVAVMVNLQRIQHILNAAPASDTILLLLFALCGALGLGVGALTALHTHLLLTGQTTLEFYGRLGRRDAQRQVNPHDKGALRNFQDVFGQRPWLVALLPQMDDVTRKLRRN